MTELDPRLARPTFRKVDLPEAPVEEVRKYKTYLTRLSKWKAWKESNEQGLIRQALLRSALIRAGEVASYLDDAWAKRIFGDKEFFEDAGDGFWRVTVGEEGSPSAPPQWQGQRPGEDVLGSILARLAEGIDAKPHTLNPRTRYFDADEWDPIHREMLRALEYAKKRGVEKPLNELQERAFQESLLDDDYAVQVIACWLLNTRQLVDVMQRMTVAARGETNDVQVYEVAYWGPPYARGTKNEKGEIVPMEEPPTVPRALDYLRRTLLNRGILSCKKQ